MSWPNVIKNGISDYNINRLQRIQNSAVCIVTNTRKYDHITPILQNLHRLPVRQRIHFKILLITYKSVNDMAPEYLCELVSIRKSSRKLGSSSQILLHIVSSIIREFSIVVFTDTEDLTKVLHWIANVLQLNTSMKFAAWCKEWQQKFLKLISEPVFTNVCGLLTSLGVCTSAVVGSTGSHRPLVMKFKS